MMNGRLIACLVLASLAGWSQDQKATSSEAAPPQGVEKKAEGDPADVLSQLIKTQMIPYNPTLKRDPFEAPIDNTGTKTGLLIDEVAFKGVTMVRGQKVAIILDNVGNYQRVGIRQKGIFADGEITGIDATTIYLSQWDMNSTNRSAVRTVKKPFKREEGRR